MTAELTLKQKIRRSKKIKVSSDLLVFCKKNGPAEVCYA